MNWNTYLSKEAQQVEHALLVALLILKIEVSYCISHVPLFFCALRRVVRSMVPI